MSSLIARGGYPVLLTVFAIAYYFLRQVFLRTARLDLFLKYVLLSVFYFYCFLSIFSEILKETQKLTQIL